MRVGDVEEIAGPKGRVGGLAVGDDQPDQIGPASVQQLQERLNAGLIASGPVWVQRFPNSTSLDDLDRFVIDTVSEPVPIAHRPTEPAEDSAVAAE